MTLAQKATFIFIGIALSFVAFQTNRHYANQNCYKKMYIEKEARLELADNLCKYPRSFTCIEHIVRAEMYECLYKEVLR